MKPPLSAMVFRHWTELEDGTVALNPGPSADDDTLAASTFYCQVSKDPRLHTAVECVQVTFTSVIRNLDADLQRWHAYEHVWRRDKGTTVARFCRSGPSVKDYDDKLRFYTHLASELSQASHHNTHGCVSLDVRPLVGQVVKQAEEWMKLLGSGLLSEARTRLDHVLLQVKTINSNLERKPEDLAALTVVLRAVGEVRYQHAHLHTDISDVRQMFHTLHVYGIQVQETEHRKLDTASEKLEILQQNALKVQRSLGPVHAFHLANTQSKVADFSTRVDKFHSRFENSGPGAVGEDLEKGLELLKMYSEEMGKLEKERKGLDEEEDVFDLPATQYPGLDHIVLVMARLKKVFNIYQQLRSVEMTWRTMRWASARLEELKRQVDGVRGALEECVEGERDTHVWRALQQRLLDHTTSLEVTAILRQPAVQVRHWQHLVAASGCGGKWGSAVSVGSVSVWDVLELRLSRHPGLVSSTVATAVKEDQINNHIKDISNFWQRARLSVCRDSSVWCIEGLEELLTHLHNHNLALKAMRGTRFCRPFLNEASLLARTLVSVEELVEAWQDTQGDVCLLLSPLLTPALEETPEIRAKHRQLLERTERRAFVVELAGNRGYVEEVRGLQRYAHSLVTKLSASLAPHRRLCARFYFLTDHELMALLAHPTPERLNSIVHKIFNNIESVRWSKEGVIGLVSVEGEELSLSAPVCIDGGGGGKGVDGGSVVGEGVQQLLHTTHLTVKAAVQKAIEDLGKERKLQRSLLQEVPLATATVAWRVWWAAGVDMALTAAAKGNRQVLRQQLDRVNEDITLLLAVTGRGEMQQQGHHEDDEEALVPLSWASPSGPRSSRTARLLPSFSTPHLPLHLPLTRCLSLLMAALHARDVIATLLRHNACSVEDFWWTTQLRYSWQPQHARLSLQAAHRSVAYGHEYSGCGPSNLVLTPPTERSLLATLTAVAAHTPPILTGESGGGRQMLVEAAAHLAGRFLVTFTFTPLTPPTTLTSLLSGALGGGSWVFLRECNVAPPLVLAALSATLLSIHHAHTYTPASPILQVAGEEVKLDPGAGLVLSSGPWCGGPLVDPICTHGSTNTTTTTGDGSGSLVDPATTDDDDDVSGSAGTTGSLAHTLESLSRPVLVTAPPPRTLVFVWLLAEGVPRAQEVSEAVAEVLGHVLGSYRPGVGAGVGLRLYLRFTQEVTRLVVAEDNTWTPLEAAVIAFREVFVPRLPRGSLAAVDSVLDLLCPPEPDSPQETPRPMKGDVRRRAAEAEVKKMGLKVLQKQTVAVESLAQELTKWGCVVVTGPPTSGKTTTISAAIRLFQRQSIALLSASTRQHTPSTGYKSTSRSHQTRGRTSTRPATTSSRGHMSSRGGEDLPEGLIFSPPLSSCHVDTISVDEVDESNIEVLSSGRRLVDRHMYTLRPESYDQTRLLGNATEHGLLPCLLGRLSAKSIHSVVVVAGKGAGDCLARLRDLPGTLLLDSLQAHPPNHNLTFVVEVCSVKEVPKWVLGRAGVVQLDPDALSIDTLLPEPHFLPPTPTTATDRPSESSATPRSLSVPSTPIVHREEPPTSPAALMEYLVYRLLHPVLQLLCDPSTRHTRLAPINVMKQMESLREKGTDAGEMSVARVGDTLQAVVQAGRSLSPPSLLPHLRHTITTSMARVVGEGVLDSSLLNVIENASTSDGEAVWDHRWHPPSSSWLSWCIDPSQYPPTHTHTPASVSTRTHTPSPVSTRAHTPASVSDSVQDVSGSAPVSHHTPTADSHRLSWFIQMMINSERPVVVMGGPGSGKSTTTLMALRALHTSWRTVVVRVNAGTTSGDLETALLSHVSRAAHDTLAPTTPTILCLDDVGTLQPGSRAGRYLLGVGRDRGLYDTTTRARWMALTRLNLVAVCTVEEGVAAVGGADDPWRGWAVYHLAHTEDAATTAITAAVAPRSPLQSHAHNALTHATVLIAERILPLVRRRQEPFAPASAQVLLWQVAVTLRVSMPCPPTTTTTTTTTTPSSPTSSATEDMLTVWLHAVTSHALLPLCSSKSRSEVWEEVQAVMSQSCGGLLRELPPHPPTPLWPPLAPTLTLARPTYTTPKEAARRLSQVEQKRRKGPTEAWVVGQHEGVAEGVSLVVDAVMALLHTHARTAPLLLVLGAPTPDTALTLTLAADYLGTKLRSCTTESDVLVALVKREDGGGGVGDGGATGGNEDLTSTTGPSLIHIPKYLLHDADVLRRVLEVTAEEGEVHARVCVVTGCRGDFVGGTVSEQLRWAARHGRVVCLPNHTHDHHTQFTLQLMARDKFLQSEGISGHVGIAEFLAGVHTACCGGDQPDGGHGEGTERGADGAIMTPRPPHHHLPGVAALLNTIIVFSRLLKERKAAINAKQKKLYDTDHCDFDLADFDLADFDLADFDLADFDLADYDLADYDLADYDLADYDLADYDLADYDLADYDLADYDFADYDFADYDFADYDLGDYDLGDFDLGDYDLADYDLADYDLADFDLADFDLADFDLADFDLADFDL
ncbi:hypothetical protein Pcinc_037532 [Petrolisthes cinctipes]|uniref:AAA+ ATPase domain-containing protein n=1 Tax=Petrolisthes cinctipes TaxID=88211 RepID=A0AAE1EL99_PETCI|nr:hypothetical protein Pcinc_037532 [Petrolisthes cinctipes]